jgi:hypothetical protein
VYVTEGLAYDLEFDLYLRPDFVEYLQMQIGVHAKLMDKQVLLSQIQIRDDVCYIRSYPAYVASQCNAI